MNKVTIIYVEDSLQDVLLMKLLKKRFNDCFDLIVFGDGIKFFDFINHQCLQGLTGSVCILLDINLPLMDGFEILTALKTSKDPFIQALPVYMYSSSNRICDRDKGKALGAVLHIQKPSTLQSAELIINYILSSLTNSPLKPALDF